VFVCVCVSVCVSLLVCTRVRVLVYECVSMLVWEYGIRGVYVYESTRREYMYMSICI
jgi:hypothetical protein